MPMQPQPISSLDKDRGLGIRRSIQAVKSLRLIGNHSSPIFPCYPQRLKMAMMRIGEIKGHGITLTVNIITNDQRAKWLLNKQNVTATF